MTRTRALLTSLLLALGMLGVLIGHATRPVQATVNGQGTPTLYGAADTAQCGLLLIEGRNFPVGVYQPVTVSLPDGTVLASTDRNGTTGLDYRVNLRDDAANKFGDFGVLLRVHPPAGAASVVLSARFAQDPYSYSGAPDYTVPLGPACGG